MKILSKELGLSLAVAFWAAHMAAAQEPGQETAGPVVFGQDTNGNGLWDDVDAYIADTYGNDTELKGVIEDLALTYQNVLLAQTREEASERGDAMSSAMSCLYDHDGEHAGRMASELEAYVFGAGYIEDRDERMRLGHLRSTAYFGFSDLLAGSVSYLQPCTR